MTHAIALDIGGTNIRFALVDKKGKILFKIKRPTTALLGKEQVIRNITNIIKDALPKIKHPVKGIGISMPGFVDNKGKIIFGGGTLRFLRGAPLKKIIEKEFGLPVIIENDANCFALAEATHGAGKGFSNVIGVIWGTGIGGGIVIDKKLMRGRIGGAGEFGHIIVTPHLKYQTVEWWSSGKNIVKRYVEGGGNLRNADVTDIYKSKEKVAKDVIESAVHHLGIGLATMVNTLNPDIIVIGGGVSKVPLKLYLRLSKKVKEFSLPTHTKNLKIVRHKISDDAGILGAATLVFKR